MQKLRFTKVGLFGIAVVLMLASCGGGGSGGGAPELVEAVATTMRPTPDGYSFANFAAKGSPEEFGSADLVAMFGEGACVGGVIDPCEPIAEAAAWARMVNQSRASGHCEGLVVEASKRFNKAASPQTVELKNEGEVTHRIFQTFATQFLKETQDETAGWQKKSLRQIVDELGASFQTGALKYSMGLYSASGGHAVLPYAIDFIDPDHAVVHLYDSNWPGKNRYVEIDLEAKTWKFSFSGSDPANDPKAWTGGAGDIDLTSLDARSSSLCPFCVTETKVKNSMLVIKSTDANWSITTDRGTYSPSDETLIPGISSRPIKGSAGVVDPWPSNGGIFAPLNTPESPGKQSTAVGVQQALEFVVFVEGTDMKLKFPSPTSAFVSQGTAVVQLVSGEASNAEVTVSQTSVSVNDPNMTVTVASENLVAAVAGNNTVVDIGAAQLNIATESASGQQLNVVADAQTPQIVAKAVIPDGSTDGAQFVFTTKSADDVTKVYEVSNTGVETVKVVEQALDLNSVTAELPPELAQVNIKEGLPPPEVRDLSNPIYVADPVFVPTSGVVASRLEGSRACDVPGYPTDWIIQANATSCTAPVLQLAAATTQTRNTVGDDCSVGGVDGIWTAFGGSGTTICSPRIVSAAAKVTTQNITGQPCTEYGITGTWTSVAGVTVCQNLTVKNIALETTTTTTTIPPTTTTVPPTTTTTTTTTTVPPTTTTTTTVPPTTTTTTTTTVPPTTTTTTTTTTTVPPTTTTTSAPVITTPSAPSGVSGTAGNSQVLLTWTAPTSNGGSSITDYVIEFNDGYEWMTFVDGESTSTSATITGLVNGVGHTFRVSAVNSRGTGSTSTSGSVTPRTTPSALTSLSGTAGNTQVVLTWSAPVNGGAVITDYVVEYSSNSGTSWSTFADGTSSSTGATVTGLTNGTSYIFRLSATNSVGTGATYTSSSITPSTTPSAPTISAITASSASLSVALTAGSDGGSAITSYKYSTDGGVTFRSRASGTTGSPIVISMLSSDGTTALVNGTSYSVQIKALNSNGDGAASATTTATPTASVPGTPTDLVGTTGTSQIQLSWLAPSSTGGASITDYIVQYSSNSGTSWSTFADGTSTSTNTTVTGLTNGTPYIFKVSAANSSGNGSASSSSRSITPVAACTSNCAVGDVGPGGGIIFITPTTTGNSTGKYFEAAPFDLDSKADWCGSTVYATISGAVSTEIGSGESNSAAMVAYPCTSGAGYLADAYVSPNGTADWFLPSSLEFTQACAQKTVTGLRSSATYKSSTNYTSPNYWGFVLNTLSCGGDNYFKGLTGYVRPVRSFTTPGSVTGLSGTEGNGQVALTWTAPTSTGGAAITDYAVQYSSNSGTTWSTFADGTSTATSATVTGLSNGTSYIFRVSATNAAGTGTTTTSSAFTPNLVASALAVTTQPVGNASGSALATQPVVRIVDSEGNTVTTSTASVTVTASGGTLGGTTTVSAVSGVATFTNLTHTTAGSYTLTFASTSPTALTSITSASFTTSSVPLTCATGGTCAVGETGPGGGTVFYVASSNFTSTGSDCNTNCKYLEAAPANWLTGTTGDPLRSWSTDNDAGVGKGNQEVLVTGADGTLIGSGYRNSLDIVAQTGNVAATSAAVEARAYQGNSKTDWYLPSKVELNELCKYARTQTTGNTSVLCSSAGSIRPGFSSGTYWSSSEFDNYRAWYHAVWAGLQGAAQKSDTNYVRPVRAFGPAQLSITTQPVGGASGSALTTQPVVRIVDSAGNTLTSSTASVTATASGGTLGGTTTVSAVNGVATFTNLTHTTDGTYTLTFTTTNVVSVTSSSVTTATCADGGTCTVGVSTGGGGGTVFYYSATAFTSTGSACGTNCHYLEVAPAGWIVSSSPASQTNCTTAGTSTSDPRCEWSGNTNNPTYTAGSAIGRGHQNTSYIVGHTGTAGKAATASRAYQGGSKTDWFLPSTDELNQLCRYAWNLEVSNTATTCTGMTGSIRTGFTSGHYWSSSQDGGYTAWDQDFSTGTQASFGKGSVYSVRPVRAG